MDPKFSDICVLPFSHVYLSQDLHENLQTMQMQHFCGKMMMMVMMMMLLLLLLLMMMMRLRIGVCLVRRESRYKRQTQS